MKKAVKKTEVNCQTCINILTYVKIRDNICLWGGKEKNQHADDIEGNNKVP